MMKCFGSSIKVYRCKIILLDETELIQEIKESQKGQDILDIVFKHLDLLETVYFGLRFIDSKGFSNWLEPNKNAIKQVKEIEPITLYFGVKFYASDPCKLREECTRYQFFLQIKQDIQQSRLPVTNELAAQLLAYIIQCKKTELGDYDPKIHQFGYVSEFCWIENQSLDFENKVCDLHKKLIGQIPTAVEMQFLERCKWLDLYGCELHSVMAEDRYEYYLGLGPHGIIVLKNKLKIAYYYWPRIIKIWRKGKFFMIKVIDKNNVDKTYGFEMYDRISTNRIYKSCKDHKEFFKLSQSIRMQPILMSNQLNDGNKFSSSSNGAIRMINQDFNRPNPSLIRVSSRRFRRTGVPDGSENGDSKLNKNEQFYEGGGGGGGNSNKCLQSNICRFNSTPSIPKAEYSTTAINPYYNNKSESGLFSKSASASPLSVRSAFVARYDYGRMNYVSPMKRNSSTTSLRRNRSSRSADNDSEISRYSSKNSTKKLMSIHSSSIHRNGVGVGGGDGGGCYSDINIGYMPRSRRKYYVEPQMVEWNETMDKRIMKNYSTMPTSITATPKQCSNAVVKNVNKIIYQSSNNRHYDDSDSETEDRRRYKQQPPPPPPQSSSSPPPLHYRSNRSLNRKSALPSEIQKYIFHEPIDTTGYTEAEKKNIQFTKIRTEQPQQQQQLSSKYQQQQRSSKSDVEYYLGNNRINYIRKPMLNSNQMMDDHQQQQSSSSHYYHRRQQQQSSPTHMMTDKIYFDKSNIMVETDGSGGGCNIQSNMMTITSPPPTRYYFNQKNLIQNGHHHHQQQQNMHQSLPSSTTTTASPRVTFLPTHSTAYYSNND
ncbi:hypothetical protein DERP_003426, partial [Dermatophagoides pteronyssinus]